MTRSFSAWRLTDRGPRLLTAAMLAAFAAYAVVNAEAFVAHMGSAHPDFWGMWAFARFLRTHPAADLYDPDMLVAFEWQLDPGFHGRYLFPHPPAHLFDIWPLGLLPLYPAQAAWVALTGAGFVAAVAAPRWSPALVAAAVLAPASVIAAAYGQTGFLGAALTIGGLRLAGTRPVTAGILLGCLCYKPQLAVLVPVALLAGGHWRAIVAAAATIAGLVVASSVVFGATIWRDWIAAIPRHAALLAELSSGLNPIKPTLTSNLETIGVSQPLVSAAQIAAAIVCVVVVWLCARRGGAAATVTVLPVATFLATPYAFVYDMPMVAGAILIAVADPNRSDRSWTIVEIVVLALGLLLPVQIFTPVLPAFPVSSLVLAPLLWVLARRVLSRPGMPAGSR